MYLCPLLGSNGHQNENHVQPIAVPAGQSRLRADVNVARLTAILKSHQSDLLPQQTQPAISEASLAALPPWAQTVIRAQSEAGPSAKPQEVKNSKRRHNGASKGDVLSKRARQLEKKPHLDQPRPDDDDSMEGVALSQDTEGGDGDATQRSTFTHAKRLAEQVEKYSRTLEQVVEAVQNRLASDAMQDSSVDLFTNAEIKTLVQSLKIMHKNGLIGKCEPDLLVTLIGHLDKQVQIGLTLDILGTMMLNNGDEEWQPSGIDVRLAARIQSSLDVALCELLIMSTPGIDRRILSEEIIDNCIQLFNNSVQRLILPCIDPTMWPSLSSQDRPRSAQKGSRCASPANFNVKSNKNVRKAMERLVPVVFEFMEQLSQLITVVKLADRWILHFSTAMTSLFLLEYSAFSTALQRGGILVLRGIFLEYGKHRDLVLDEIVTVIMKLPTAKRNLRTVKLFGSSNTIQMVTTLVCALMQVCASVTPSFPMKSQSNPAMQDGEHGDEMARYFAVGMNAAKESAKSFVSSLLRECLKKNEERDNRVVLENFVDDLLVMFVHPEWTGAEVLLEVLSTSLAGIVGTNLSKDSRKLESQHSLMALQLVGRICACIKMHQSAALRETFDDETSQSLYHDHEEYIRDLLFTGSERNTSIGEDVVLKHIVVYYMRNSLHETIYQDAKRMLLSRFIAESTNAGGEVGLDAPVWHSHWDSSSTGIDSASKVVAPSADIGMRAHLHLVIAREFCSLFDTLLMHLMALLTRGIPTFRARVMKALGGIVDVDPMLMAETNVRTAVSRCFLDEATSVRQAAVDLVGKYITLQPLLFDRYFGMLSERLRDKGISVRKSVCRIFRMYLVYASSTEHSDLELSNDDLRRRSTCMRSLVERVGDIMEEEVVKNFIIDTFQEVWFGSELSSRQLSEFHGFTDENAGSSDVPPGWTIIESTKNKRQGIEYMSTDGSTVSSIKDAWAAYRTPQITPSSVVKSKQSKMDDTPDVVSTIVEVTHDMTNLDWFVALLRRLLHDESNGTASKDTPRKRSIKDRSDDVAVAQARSEKIVACLIECLMQLEEDNELKGVTIEGAESQFLSCFKALGAFAEASPVLLLPHIEALMVYLKSDDKFSKATESKVQSVVVGMVSNVVAHSERISNRVADMLEDDLKTLIFRAPPSVVGPSIRCLATLATHTRRPPVLLFKLLDTFYGYLAKFMNVESLATIKPDVNGSLQRALFAAGQIGGSLDLDEYDVPEAAGSKLTKGTIMDSLYSIYSVYLSLEGNAACTAKAFQGLGYLFKLRPRFLLQMQQDGVLDRLLQKSSNEVKLQCVVSMKELLQHEELRLERGAAKKKMNKEKSKQEQVQGDQEGEASLIGGVMQAQLPNILALSLEKQVRVRSEAAACIAVLLTQGLVSPLHCIPNLVALETDQVVPIRDLAHSQLVALHDKFPTLLNTPAIQGILLSYSFQVKVFGKCSVFALDKDKKEYSLFGRLYTSCLRSQRTQRSIFLKALINQFSDNGSIFSASDFNSNPMQSIGYLSYLAQVLTALPYDVEDEPLYLIYLINRYVTLKLGPILQELKQDFAALGIVPAGISNDDFDMASVDITSCHSGDLDDSQLERIQGLCCIAYAIHLLVRIKFFLKEIYLLDNERCQTYQPGVATNATDQAVVVAERAAALQVPTTEDLQGESLLELTWNLFVHTWQAFQDDQHQMDFDVHEDGRSKKKKGRRRKTVTKLQVESEGEEVEGFDG
ncbi:hypothetical protein Poli38472_006137 [Pythium oligandrum]|uniref:Sister chromatid cohesion protein n=1 Tax=Pythium oligandrum TaxID=41045 RepID=A0A8K1FPS6_PYTOL|nr:hypothetical protein Poli38472_006137 [Pythium oligandrum]|eukprot:TMW68669.1 hypothetical protein Poli38472_006137 [Pythium oligandrum]